VKPQEQAREMISSTERCLAHGIIDREEALRAINDMIEYFRKMHKEIELALEELLEFKRRLEEAEKP
jgi:hypothetical protein